MVGHGICKKKYKNYEVGENIIYYFDDKTDIDIENIGESEIIVPPYIMNAREFHEHFERVLTTKKRSYEWFSIINNFITPYITTPELYKVARELLDDYAEKLENCPGSDGQHHWCSLGLLRHIIGVAENVVYLCNKYKFLNMEVMIFGAVFHDIGKINDYIWNTNKQTWDLSTSREVITHVPESLMIIKPYLDKYSISEEYKIQLLSVIGQHMGDEIASVCEMNSPESIYLNFADHIDALSDAISVAKDDVKCTGWSSEVIPVANKKLYFF